MKDNKYSDLYFQDSVDKQIVMEVVGTGISIDNSMMEQGSFSLTETLCSQSELTFGACEPNHFTVTVHDMPRSIKGAAIVVREYLGGHTDNPLTYGVYKVYGDVPTSDRTKREITAYDAMYDIINADMKPWYAGISFPMTLRQFRDSFFAYFGITQKETTLVNDGMTVNKTLTSTQTDSESTITEESSISGKTVIEAICEINGVFGNINRDGEFEYVELKDIIDSLYPADDLYPSDDLFPRDPNTVSMTGHYVTFDYEDFQSKSITQLEIRTSDDSAGATVGISGNNYVISGNFLVSDKTGSELTQIAANTLSIIRKASYTPLKSSEIVGNPCIELGDPIRFNTTREIVESYVLQRTLTGIQNKRDSIVSPGTETHNQNPNSIRDQIASVQRRTNKLERTADHTLSELSDLDANTTSRFEQTASQIQAEVSYRESADSEIKASLELKIDCDDDGTIISLINGSADKIHFNANNMFTVDAPNITIDENGQVEIGGNFIADTAMYLCYNYASLPDMSFASKINVLNVCGGSFTKYYIASTGIFSEFFTATGLNTPVMKIGEDSKIQAVITDKQLQVGSIYATDGMFNDIALGFAIGTYGGRVYNCCDSVGDNGIASPGWVKNYVSAKMPDTSSFATVDSSGYVSNARYASSAGSASSATYADSAGSAKRCENESSNSHTANCFISDSLIVYKVPSGSARRFKTDIEPVVDAGLDPHRLYNIGVVQFKYKPSFYGLPEGTEMPTVIGMLADDVDKEYPCACEYDDDTGEVINWLERYMIPPMLALIQEQHADIESLKQENLAMQNRLSILEQKMEEIANVINNQNN